MQVGIFCAGTGSRLGDITQVTAKPAIEIGGIPCVSRIIDSVRKAKIIDESKPNQILINVHHLPETVKDAILKYHLDIEHCITFTEEKNLLNTAGALASWKNLINEEAILLFNGDMLLDITNLHDLLDFHVIRRSQLTIGSGPVGREKLSEKGVIVTDKLGRVTYFVEKPQNLSPNSTLRVNNGVYVINKELIDYIHTDKPSSIGKDFIPDMVYIGKRVYNYQLEGLAIDIGTPEDLETAQIFAEIIKK